MAVPFNMPEDQNEVEVIISQLQALLTKLQAVLRRTDSYESGILQLSVNPRIRTTTSLRSRPRNEDIPVTNQSVNSSSAHLPDLLSNLAWLASASHEAVWTDPSQLPISQRTRTESEFFCNDNTKISCVSSSQGQLQDWNQVGVDPSKITDDFPKEETDVTGTDMPQPKSVLTEVIFSKFVPGPISAPLWTAMICVVGWHLFRAR